MNRSQALSVPPATYDGFLFAQVCEEANGMHLSVLSALARMNIDPWQEAMRLAAMPKAVAVEKMKSMLCLVSGKTWHGSEATATAERLINLLESPDKTKAERGAEAPEQLKSYWFLWAGLAVAFMLFTTYQQASQDTGTSTSPSTIASSPNGAAPLVKPAAEPLPNPNSVQADQSKLNPPKTNAVMPSVPLSR